MVFTSDTISWVIFFVFVAWVVGLSVIVLRMVRHYNTLTGTTNRTALKDVLEVLLQTQKGLQSQTKDLYKTLDDVRKDGRLHIQRVGLVRFNPFSDTGGSQSFTLALLDGHDNGLVMTSLYARTGNRWYIKEVRSGKGKELVLSKEELTAVQKAKPFEGSIHE
ncbi:MAG: DUF4446 family protein [Candidatus Gottesmanbacteria bacterium]|nr:DUF4446 family protein [Candidatus Gottesmanbacteria bacterium]